MYPKSFLQTTNHITCYSVVKYPNEQVFVSQFRNFQIKFMGYNLFSILLC